MFDTTRSKRPPSHVVVAERRAGRDAVGDAVGGGVAGGPLDGDGIAVDGLDRTRAGGRQPDGEGPVAAAHVEHGSADVRAPLGQPAQQEAGAGVDRRRAEQPVGDLELDADAVLPVARAGRGVSGSGTAGQDRARRRAAASPKSRIGGEHPVEGGPGPGHLAGPLVEVAEDVEQAEVVGRGSCGGSSSPAR